MTIFSKWIFQKPSSQIIIVIFFSRQLGEEGLRESVPAWLLESLVLVILAWPRPLASASLSHSPHHPQVEFLVSFWSMALKYTVFFLPRQTWDSQDWTASLTANPEEHKKPFCFPCFQSYSQNGPIAPTSCAGWLPAPVSKVFSKKGNDHCYPCILPSSRGHFNFVDKQSRPLKKTLTLSVAFKGLLSHLDQTRPDQTRPDKPNSHKGPGFWTLTCSSSLNSVTMNSIVVKRLLAGWGWGWSVGGKV